MHEVNGDFGVKTDSVRERKRGDGESGWVELVAKCALQFVGWSYGPLKQVRVWVSFGAVTAWKMVQQWTELNVLFCNNYIYSCSEMPHAPPQSSPCIHPYISFSLCPLKPSIYPSHRASSSSFVHLFNFAFAAPQDENIHDVLQLLVALMSEHPASMIPAFDQRNGIRWNARSPTHARCTCTRRKIWCCNPDPVGMKWGLSFIKYDSNHI